jgi:hypothetical protein
METAERVLVEQLVEPGAADHAAVTAAFDAIARVVRAAAARWGLRLSADPHAEAVTREGLGAIRRVHPHPSPAHGRVRAA